MSETIRNVKLNAAIARFRELGREYREALETRSRLCREHMLAEQAHIEAGRKLGIARAVVDSELDAESSDE